MHLSMNPWKISLPFSARFEYIEMYMKSMTNFVEFTRYSDKIPTLP